MDVVVVKLEKNIFLLLTFQLSPSDKDIEDTIVRNIMRNLDSKTLNGRSMMTL